MTALSVAGTAASASRGTSQARMRDLIPAEWIKLSSLRSTCWVLASMVGYALYVTYTDAQQDIDMIPRMHLEDMATYDLSLTTFFAPAWLLLMVAAGVVGALTVAGEHASGLIRTTFTAVPDRRRVVAAKTAVVAGALAVTGFLCAVGCYALALAEMSSHYQGLSMTTPTALRGIAVTTLLFPICGLAGIAFGTLIRNVPATVLAVVGTFVFLPVFFKSDLYWWSAQAMDCMPWYSWFRLVATTKGHIADPHTVSTVHAWATLAAWPVVSVLLAVIVMNRRDV